MIPTLLHGIVLSFSASSYIPKFSCVWDPFCDSHETYE